MRWLLNLLPKNEIDDECHDSKDLLMTRYYLTPKIFGFRLVLHQFHRSDNDRHYHDHPWNFISIILKGSYIEHFPVEQFNLLHKDPRKKLKWSHEDTRFWKEIQLHIPRFTVIKRPKTWKHWVELPCEPVVDRLVFTECWTLVLLYGERRDWGFWTEKGWIKHDKYDCRGSYDNPKRGY